MKCHQCVHRSAIQAGEFSNVAWEETPCSRCELHEGGYSVAFDENRLPKQEGYAGMDQTFAEEGEDVLMPVSVLGEVVQSLMDLSEKSRQVIARRFQGQRYREIGQELEISPAAAELQTS